MQAEARQGLLAVLAGDARRVWRFVSDGPGRLLTLATIATLAYGVLYAMHERYLAHLGVTAADVGLGREQLLGAPVLGLAAATLLILAFIVIAAVITLGLMGVPGRLALAVRPRRRPVVGLIAVVLLAGGSALSLHGGVAALPGAACMLAGFGALVALGIGSALLGPEDAPLIYVLLVASLAGSAYFALKLGYRLADDTAAHVEAGVPVGPRTLFGLPILASDARAIHLTSGVPALDGDARRHVDCLLWIGHADGLDVLWDVRRQRALQVALPAGAFELGGGTDQVPPQCAPEPSPLAADEPLARGHAAADVRAAGHVVGWEEQLDGDWVIVLAQDGAVLARLHATRRRQQWDVGPGTRPRSVALAMASCDARRCTLRWSPLGVEQLRPLSLSNGPGCRLDAVAVAGARIAVARSGERCGRRGVWLHGRSGWRALVRFEAGERATSMDLGPAAVAWSDARAGVWTVRRLRLGSRRPQTVAAVGDALDDGQAYAGAVEVLGDHVRWSESDAETADVRRTAIEDADGRFTCRELAFGIPGRADGQGVDAATADGRVVYTTGSFVMTRRLSKLSFTRRCPSPLP